jgi:hypothetical protein
MEKKARNPGLYLIRAGIQIPVTAISIGIHILVIVQQRREISNDVVIHVFVIFLTINFIMLHQIVNLG